MTDKTAANTRRNFLAASAALPAMGLGMGAANAKTKDKDAACPPVPPPPQIYGSKNFFLKQIQGGQPVKLYMWRKQLRDRSQSRRKGAIIFVHGSATSGTPASDLRVPNDPDYSMMDWFAKLGYDTWCPDMEGYGQSEKARDINFDIGNGADDLLTISSYVAQATGQKKLMFYGTGSGALRCGVFAQRYPDRVARLALDAMVWTGAGSAMLADWKKSVDEWLAGNRRPVDLALLESMVTRDNPNLSEPAVIKALVEQVLALDKTLPTGAFLDMATKLPICDPEKISVPTVVMRGQFDGTATLQDVLNFYLKLPNPDKQFAMLPGMSHASIHEINREVAFAVVDNFFGMPAPIYKG